MEIVFKNDFTEMQYDAEKAFSEQIWLPSTENMTIDDFKEFMIFWRKFAIKHKVKFHLVDAREFNFTIAPEDQEWIATQAVGPAVEQGFEKLAHILPEKDLFAQVSVEQALDENADKGGLSNFANFATVEEGKKWLLGE